MTAPTSYKRSELTNSTNAWRLDLAIQVVLPRVELWMPYSWNPVFRCAVLLMFLSPVQSRSVVTLSTPTTIGPGYDTTPQVSARRRVSVVHASLNGVERDK